MARNRLILDTDGGVDDAQALLLLIGNGRAPDAVTTVFGNVDVDTATDNVLATLAVAGVAIEVHKGAGEPLEQELIHARHVHGEDGLGGAPRPPTVGDIAGFDAVGFLVETLGDAAATGAAVDLLMIGPLTNLALALQAAPGIARGIGQLTIMGGTLHGRGNHTPAAEFNIYADPEAAAIVFATEIACVETVHSPALARERRALSGSAGPMKPLSSIPAGLDATPVAQAWNDAKPYALVDETEEIGVDDSVMTRGLQTVRHGMRSARIRAARHTGDCTDLLARPPRRRRRKRGPSN
mgnify:CR=1 FL=1